MKYLQKAVFVVFILMMVSCQSQVETNYRVFGDDIKDRDVLELMMSGEPFMMDISCGQCEMCQAMDSSFFNLSQKHPDVMFIKVKSDETNGIIGGIVQSIVGLKIEPDVDIDEEGEVSVQIGVNIVNRAIVGMSCAIGMGMTEDVSSEDMNKICDSILELHESQKDSSETVP